MYQQQGKEKKQTVESFLPTACQIELRRVKRLLEHPDGFEQNLTNKYFSAITACYDPHSSYFNLSNVQNFIAQLSSQGLSFGIHFTENEKGELEIAQLVPGGAAWNSNKLHVGDVLLKMRWEGKEAIDMIGASLEEIYNLMEQSNKGFAFFTFKQKDGTTETIKLAKTVTRQDENTVKCFVIQNKKKIGYISLPGFYENCARDVGSAILKMKKEGIEGLILDIRDNGGGSIEESADLAGIFIDQGGLFMTNSRQNKAVIVKDANRGTMYDAPLLVMVNRNSASASELLASTLQDYNRALIVGSQTFGKATGQSIFPLEAHNPKTGYVKVTRLKLYRVTGKTAQFTGVTPDIEIPDISEMDFFRESEMPYAIKPDTVAKKVIFQALPTIPKEDLRQNHFGRMTPSYNLYKLVELVKKANNLQEELYKKIPLDSKGFAQWNENLEKSLPTSESLQMQDKLLTVNSLQADTSWLAQDQYAQEMHQIVLKSISQDAHIAECYQILLDWIALK
jgi:carboxyl-terminal processing protease